jgi:hypothetical protein
MHVKSLYDSYVLATLIRAALETSRFTATVEPVRNGVKLSMVRLRQSKHYCGQHPNECPVRFFDRPHRKGSWLEGADWVGFNDGLNDLFDLHGISAHIWSANREAERSGRFYIRRGTFRRLDYDSTCRNVHGFLFFAWVMDGEFADYCGRVAPRATFPSGTPGEAVWNATNLQAI